MCNVIKIYTETTWKSVAFTHVMEQCEEKNETATTKFMMNLLLDIIALAPTQKFDTKIVKCILNRMRQNMAQINKDKNFLFCFLVCISDPLYVIKLTMQLIYTIQYTIHSKCIYGMALFRFSKNKSLTKMHSYSLLVATRTYIQLQSI